MLGQQLIDLMNEARHATRYEPSDRHRAMLDELQSRLEAAGLVLQGATVATLALLSAARGDLSAARSLFESVWWIPSSSAPVEHAFHWLLVDAAAEGRWKRVDWLVNEAGRDELVQHGEGWSVQHVALAPKTAEVALFRELSWRAVRSGASPGIDSDARVRLPHEALGFERAFSGVAPGREKAEPPDDGPLAALYRAVLELPERPTDQRLAQLSKQAHHELTSRELRDELFARATLLGGGDPEEALTELRELLHAEFGRRLFKARWIDDPLLLEVAAAQRREALDACEARLNHLVTLLEEDRGPPPTELWREFVAVRNLYQRAVDLSPPGERAWPHQVVLRSFRYVATWLRLNGEALFAQAMFIFLAIEAHRANDVRAFGLALEAIKLCKGE